MKLRQSIFLLSALAMIAALIACGGSTSTTTTPPPPPAISVAFSPAAPTTLTTGAMTPLTAVVSNDSSNSGVTWTVTCGSSGACGSFSPTATASGMATTYTAPPAVPTGNTVTVTAASVKDSTKSASATIAVTAPAAISVAFSPAPPTTLVVKATAALTAVVSNDSANGGVTWTVTCGSAGKCGSFSPTASLSGAPTTYTAPTKVPSGGSVTVTATSVTDTTKSASATITITKSAGSPLADGSYVFYLQGSNGATTGQAYFVAGQFVVSGGVITGGEQDFVNLNGPFRDLINGPASAVTTTTDSNLQITLTTCNGIDCTGTDSSVGVAGVETINGSLVSTSRALITEFDTSATSSGTLDLQTSAATLPQQGYAFQVHGLNSGGTHLAIGGVIDVNGSATISGTGSVFDLNNQGVLNAAQTFNASTSTVSGPDTNGRVVFTLKPTSGSIPEFTLVGYIVDGTHIRLVEASDALGGDIGGLALGQGSATGTFSSIDGQSYVVSMAGADLNGELQVAGVLTATNTTTVTGTLSYNDLTAIAPSATVTATGYTEDPTGRVTISGVTDSIETFNVQLYLDGAGNAEAITMDAAPGAHVLAGAGFQQSSGTLSAASFSGNYGMNATGADKTNQFELDAVGVINADGSSAFTGNIDVDLNWLSGSSGTVGVQSPGLTVTGTFAGSTGVLTGTITGLDVTTKANADAFTYYLVDTTKVVAIETDANQLTLGYFELAP